MDSEQISDRSAPSPVTFDRDRLLDLVGDLERDIALVETAMEDIERDNYDSVDAALVALTPAAPPAPAAPAVPAAPAGAVPVVTATPPSGPTPIFTFAHLGAAPSS
jgi:hypothetical protein